MNMSKLIYLAGGMTGLSNEEMNGWRMSIKNEIEASSSKEWICANPCEHVPYFLPETVEQESMQWDLWKLKQSDLIIVDLSHPNSIGTTWELAIAAEHGIPIIGFYTDKIVEIHPWWKMHIMHICKNSEDLFQYLWLHFF